MAQETVARERKLTPEVVEEYTVLKSNYDVMQGTYAAYLKKTLIAAGRYNNNKKVGTWSFFDSKGVVKQRFNYDDMSLTYEAPQEQGSQITYVVDDSLKNDYKFLRPIRIGGNYYGYLPYINLVRLPAELKNLQNETEKVRMELLVSPGGRLAEFKLRIRSVNAVDDGDDVLLNVNVNLLADEDKIYMAGKLNDNPVPVRILIPCQFYRTDRIRLP
ncbi:hypothetical protein [Mucilaginibacter sp. PAMB04168]|uniref:hypothetical protein n=1 Tax=Mucilaginibacter sp. PAMB04168 TaxID=3138567 RepID=UPI0031F61C7D